MSAEVSAATAPVQITDEKAPNTPEMAPTATVDDNSESIPDVPTSDAPIKAEGQTAADTTELSAPAAPAAADTADGAPVQDEPKGPLADLGKKLATIISEAGHSEMWGVDLTNIRDIPTRVVLQKFLRANNSEADKAQKQLLDALKWRKEFKPGASINELHSHKFDGLGYVTVHKPTVGEINRDTVICWNIYGGVKDRKATFSNLDEFMRWRVALMEMSVQKLNLADLTESIPEDGDDPYRMIQVHDYMDVSFLRLDPDTKAASRKVIEVFSMAYPELLSHKYFVNVPMIMGWLFGFFKLFVSKETISKFHLMTNGSDLANELKSISQTLPGAYGGDGPVLKDDPSAIAPKLQTEPAAETKDDRDAAKDVAE